MVMTYSQIGCTHTDVTLWGIRLHFRLSLIITSSKKLCDQVAPIFAVRIDGIVMCITHDDGLR